MRSALTLLALLVTSCGSVQAVSDRAQDDPLSVVALPSATPQLPVTVTDAGGGAVTVKRADRIIATNLSGSLGEIVFSLGLGNRVVGRDISTDFAAAAALPVVTKAHDLSAEGVLALRPDVLLVDPSTGPPEVLSAIRKAGVTVVSVPEAWSLSMVYPRIRAVAAALGVPDAGERLVARTTQEVQAALADAPHAADPPRMAFLYLRGNAGVYLMGGKGSGADSMIEAIGGLDAGTAIGLEKFRPLTSEGLIKARPDVLILMDHGLASVGGLDGLLKIPGVAQTPAGQRKWVVTMDDSTLLSFGPRSGAVVRELADKVSRTTSQ